MKDIYNLQSSDMLKYILVGTFLTIASKKGGKRKLMKQRIRENDQSIKT